MATRKVELSEEHDALIERLLSEGRFQNASDVLSAGLRLLEDEEADWAATLAGIEEGLAQARRGEFAPGTGEEAVRRAFDTAMARHAARHRVSAGE